MNRRLAIDSVLLTGSDGARRALTYVANVLLANTLGPELFGVTFIGLTVLSYTLGLTDLGLASIGTREAAKPSDARIARFPDILGLKFLLAVVGGLVAAFFVATSVVDPLTRQIALLFLLALPPTILQVEWHLQGSRSYGALAISRIVFGACFLGGVALAISGAEDVASVPVVYVVAVGASAIVAMTIVVVTRIRSRSESAQTLPLMERWRIVLERSTPVGIGGLLAESMQLLPPLIIAVVLTESDVGLFAVALKLALAFMILDRVFVGLYYPRITRLIVSGSDSIGPALRRTFRTVLASGVLTAIAIALAAPFAIEIIHGPEYADSVVPLQFLGGFVAATLLNSFFSYTLIARGVERSYFRSNMKGAPIGLALIVVLTIQFGLTGAVAGIVLGEALLAVFMFIEYRRHIGHRLT